MERKLRVFLSYAKEDYETVHEIYNRLKGEGWIEPWQDKPELLPGEHWTAAIRKAIDLADVVIIFLSDNSIYKEGFVYREMNYAWERSLEKPPSTIYRIPIRLDGSEVPEDLYELDTRQWVDYFGDKKEETYKKLLMALQRRLEQREHLEAKERARAEALAKRQAEERERKEKEELAQRIAKEEQLCRETEEIAKREAIEGERREAESRALREKEEREQSEAAERAKAEEIARIKLKNLDKRINAALQFELAGDLENALKIYYEIQNIDATYPNIENKINELENEISVHEEKTRKESEEKALQEKEEQNRKQAEGQVSQEIVDKNVTEQKEKKLTASEYFEKGNKVIDPDEKIRFYNEAILLKHDFMEAFLERGNAYLNKKYFWSAIQDYTKAIQIKKNNPAAYINRGIAKFRRNEINAAIKDYNQAIRLNNHFPEAYLNRGNVYYQKRQFDAAIKDYTEAIRIKSNLVNAYWNRGSAWRAKKCFHLAAADYQRYFDFGGKNEAVRQHLNGVSKILADAKAQNEAKATASREREEQVLKELEERIKQEAAIGVNLHQKSDKPSFWEETLEILATFIASILLMLPLLAAVFVCVGLTDKIFSLFSIQRMELNTSNILPLFLIVIILATFKVLQGYYFKITRFSKLDKWWQLLSIGIYADEVFWLTSNKNLAILGWVILISSVASQAVILNTRYRMGFFWIIIAPISFSIVLIFMALFHVNGSFIIVGYNEFSLLLSIIIFMPMFDLK